MNGETWVIHAVGGGDLGFAAARDFGEREPDYEGDLNAAGTERRPLRKIFDGLAVAGEKIDGLALLGTTNRFRPGARPFFDYAQEMAARLTADGLGGQSFDPDRVTVLPIAEPTMAATEEAVARLLTERRPGECLVTTGSGAYAMSLGTVLAAIEGGVPVRLVHIDMAEEPYDIACPRDIDRYLKGWLIRHRFWDELVTLDPDHQLTWQLLAERQRTEQALARSLARTGGPGVTVKQARKLEKLWRTVQAAMFERAGRGEAVDNALLRAWFLETLSRHYGEEKQSRALPADLPRSVITLLEKVHSGRFKGGLGSDLLAASHAIPTGTTDSTVVRMMRDDRLIRMYYSATTHTAHVSVDVPRPLPRTVVNAADRWERDDVVREMVAQAGSVAWPVLGSGDILGLMAVGMDRDGRDEEDRHGLRTMLAELHRRRQAYLRQGRVRLRLLASEETTERAEALLAWARRLADGLDAEVIGPLPVGPGDFGDLHHRVVAALREAAAPTGRYGSGSLRDVDEVVLVLNPGTAAANYGMIAAGVDWALEAACPLVIAELTRRSRLPPELHVGGPVLGRLGADGVLARLAVGALRRLDVRTAARLLSLGSTRLAAVRQETEQFGRDVFADPGHAINRSDRLTLARRRWRLIAHVIGDHDDMAAYLAVEGVRGPLLTWQVWERTEWAVAAVQTLRERRDASPYGHLLDRLRAKRNQRPSRTDVRPLLDEAIAALQTLAAAPDDELITAYGQLLGELDRLSAQTG